MSSVTVSYVTWTNAATARAIVTATRTIITVFVGLFNSVVIDLSRGARFRSLARLRARGLDMF